MFVDQYAEKNNFSDFLYESKFKADISTGNYNGEKAFLIKPQTFMNLSGESLMLIKNFYKLEASDFIIIFDDMSMDFWKVRYRSTGSAWGHNGIKDIIRIFGPDFPRIKVWIGLDNRYEVSNWVLSKFDEEELIDIDTEIYEKIVEKLTEEY
jgi:peptidyl-tRNA hydrolase, PTH1 family